MAKACTPAKTKNAWTRDEYALLLRAWQDVVSDDAKDALSSKSAVVERVYERFVELSNGACKRTESAMAIQKAVLAFNFSFVVRYNLAHGANAWASLDPAERAAVYAREKTSSYHYIDLDPSMMQAMANIRSRLEAKAAADEKSAPKRPKLLKTAAMSRVKSVPRMSASDAAARAIASERRSRKSARQSSSSSSSNESDTSGYETPASVTEPAAVKPVKRVRRADDETVRVAKGELASILAAHKKTTRHLERLLASDSRRHRLASATVEPPLMSVDI